MNTEAKNTPTPWIYRPMSGTIEAQNGRFVFELRRDSEEEDFVEDIANAELIVRAVNERQGFIDLLREARSQITYMHDKFKTTGSGNAVLAKIEAALTKAGV